MIDKNFDKLIKSVLERYKSRYNQKSWERLEAKLLKAEDEDAIFDILIAEKLQSFSAPVAAGSFKRFESTYLENGSPKRKLYYYLAGIAASLLVGIFLYFNLANNNIFDNKNIASTINKEYKKVEKKSGNKALSFESQSAKKEYEIVINENNNPNRNITGEINSNSKELTSGNGFPKQIPVINSKNINAPISSVNDFGLNYRYIMNDIYRNAGSSYLHNIGFSHIKLDNFNISLHIRLNTGDVAIENKVQRNIVVNSGINDDTKNKNIAGNLVAVSNNTKSLNDDLKHQESNARRSKIAIKQSGSNILELTPKLTSHSSSVAISGYISPDLNTINTPNDKIFNKVGYKEINIGFSSGLSFSYMKGKNELGTGVEYEYITNTPHKNIVYKDDGRLYLNKIAYNNISIPFDYKYHIFNNKNWDIYAIAGASANLIAKSKYEFVEEVDEGGNIYISRKIARELKREASFENSLYGEKKYRTGSLQGGGLKNNIYFALNAGIGIRKEIIDNLYIYFEPQYRYNFNKFGPNNDLIQKVNFKLGLSKIIKI